ncbi:cytochrome P450 [Leekyejoonella antrihumi]|uniref:Cytochrome P450 n=2 Tax=Leekyejoonella antrihumi TaxID=1660198 RepID=A0A563E9C9_9MICO|nr:cytochrome P450 [Leekyejoonella antrihumi]
MLDARRVAAPISRVKLPFKFRVWLVMGHEEARAVLADATGYSTDIRHLMGTSGPATAGDIGGLGFTDPPDHTRLRHLLTPEFTRRRLARLQPRITEIVDDRLGMVQALGPRVDLTEHFCHTVPFMVICELLGVSYDSGDFQALGKARFDVTKGGPGSLGAVSRSRDRLLEEVRRQRVEPGDGLIGQIIREHGDEISDHELSGLADGVLTGGFETTASMLALGMVLLLRSDEHLRLLRDEPAAVDGVVEEMLRYLTVVQMAFPRFAKEDHDLFGMHIREGDVLLVSLSAANRDSRLGAGMDTFDPHRAPTPHLAFGHGFHRCVGAELARMELRTALPAMARRFPQMRLAVPEDELNFHRLALVYGLDELPVMLGPTSR